MAERKQKRIAVNKKPAARQLKSQKNKDLNKNHGQFDVDHFLIDEQIYYSSEIQKALADQEQAARPVLSDLDKLILGQVTHWPKVNKKSNGLNVLINGAGKISAFSKKGQSVNSSYTVDLRAKQTFTIPAEIKKNNSDLPAPSLIRPALFKDGWHKIKQLFITYHSPRFSPIKKTAEPKVAYLAHLKTALNFALIALLFIIPIRGIIIYQQIKETKIKVLGVTEEAVSNLKQGVSEAGSTNWLAAVASFSASSDYFSQAQSDLSAYNQSLVGFFESLPLTSKQIKDGKALLESGQLMSQAAAKLALIINSINQKTSLGETVSGSLAEIQSNVHEVIADLTSALNNLAEVKPGILPASYQPSFTEIQKNLPLLLANLHQTDKLLTFSGDLLGFNGSKRYLFNYQNDGEMRATGGFIGSYALVDISKGKITNLEVPPGGYYDLKAGFLEKVISPVPLHLLGTPWMIWDANWWPDYPASMAKLLWFYEKSGGPSVDGVLTFNASLLPELLKITGNISLPQYNQLLTPDNVIPALQHETEFGDSKKANQPKKIIGDLMAKVLERLMSVAPDQLMPLVGALKNSLAVKDIQLYFTNEGQQQQAHDFGWTGEIAQTDKDYLMVIRSNVAGGKTDRVIKQEVTHYAYLQADNSLVDTVAIKLTHQGDPNDVFERVLNKSYIRAYVPQGSELLEASGYDTINPALFKEVYPGYSPDKDLLAISGAVQTDAKTGTGINNEFGKTVFGNWLTLAPGESKTLTFSYHLPFKLTFSAGYLSRLLTLLGLKEAVNDPTYSLLVQSQSGVKGATFSGNLYLPENRSVVWSNSSTNKELTVKGRNVNFKEDLSGDFKIGVLIR
ncbi:MAG: DUF4012 domain-containing protein [Candidatus Komeilibacteria bacterium]|nr:DUF4012 domain-containing protein [Candidatus Komeilibacteria bacterium]